MIGRNLSFGMLERVACGSFLLFPDGSPAIDLGISPKQEHQAKEDPKALKADQPISTSFCFFKPRT